MLEVFRRKKRFFLVFEYLEHTVLEQLEARVGGLGFATARKYGFQVLRALDFMHSHDVIHRDIKPENVLVSRLGIIKLCDFGFARPYAENETFTDYVATRWYRSPELLVGDPRYGKEVDIWAVGCLYAEMMTGEPLFPGESDIDQLFQIIRVVGKLNARHQLLVTRNAMFKGMRQEQNTSLHQMFPDWTHDALDFLHQCLKMDGQQQRPETRALLQHDLFTGDNFHETFLVELRSKLAQELQGTPLMKRMPSYGSGRKKASVAVSTTTSTTTTNADNKQRTAEDDDRFQTPKAGQIGLSLEVQSSNSKPNSSVLQQPRRLSTSTGEEVGLNMAALRQYLHQHQKPPLHQKQLINVNNLIFKDGAANNRTRILSAKPTKTAGDSTTNHYQHMDTVQPTTPMQYQSLQTNDIGQSSVADHPNGHKRSPPGSILSNVSVATTVSHSPPQYFSHRRSSNIIGLQQVVDAQKNKPQKSQPLSNQPTTNNHLKKRERHIDVSLGPLNTPSGIPIPISQHDTSSPRLLAPPPWLTGNLKISTQQENKSVHQIGKRGMTDWRSSTQNVSKPSTSNQPTNVGSNPTTSDGLFGDMLSLPTCPGATGVSPYKPTGRLNNVHKKKLSPIGTANNSNLSNTNVGTASSSPPSTSVDI